MGTGSPQKMRPPNDKLFRGEPMSAVRLRQLGLYMTLAVLFGATAPAEAAHRGPAMGARQAASPKAELVQPEAPGPLRIPDSQLEPIEFSDLPNWADDD